VIPILFLAVIHPFVDVLFSVFDLSCLLLDHAEAFLTKRSLGAIIIRPKQFVRSRDVAGDQAAERSVVDSFESGSRGSREQANIRKRVVQLGVLIAFITFLDRACLGEAAPFIMRDLHLSKLQMGYVFSAFGITYTILELPSGWLVDQLGVRSILTRITFIWSLLTAATGMAWSYGSLFTIRLLFGAGEAGPR
jgi:hypothetical protein